MADRPAIPAPERGSPRAGGTLMLSGFAGRLLGDVLGRGRIEPEEAGNSGLLIVTTNRLDRRTYRASILPKQQVIHYWLPRSSAPATDEPRRLSVTLTATASRRSLFSRKDRVILVACYGIGRLEFDAFHEIVRRILSTCDLRALRSAPEDPMLDEICASYDVIADRGELRPSRFGRPIPLFMLVDGESAQRGY